MPAAPYNQAMTDGVPAVLRSDPTPRLLGGSAPHPVDAGGTDPTPPPRGAPASSPLAVPPPAKRLGAEVFVAGFWKRSLAAAIDCAIVLPAALAMTAIASYVAGVHMPPSNMRLRDIDLWIDLAIATDPALIMGLALFGAIGWLYLLVFHIARGRTLGMRVTNLKVIDLYGDPPSPLRCVTRCTAYIASAATLFLGFLWIGFDREKRGLHDWIAGTYVIRA